MSGLCSLVFGVVMMAGPGRSLEALVLLVAVYAIVIGALFIATAAMVIHERAHRMVA